MHMALFQRKPHSNTNPPLYSLGLNKTILLVGLGNPGKQYDHTRHNIGFACVDFLADKQDFAGWTDKKDLKCLMTSAQIGDKRVIMIKPTTFMNLSGEAVQAVAHFYKISTEDITVIHDELDVAFGTIRTRTGGGSAGHNGIKSITTHVGEATNRVRIGVKGEGDATAHMDTADYVLASFSKDEQADMGSLKQEVAALLTEYIHGSDFVSETRTFRF